MRQTRWASPGEDTPDDEQNLGALRAVTVDGGVLLVGMYCDAEGHMRVDLRDTSTGEVVDVHGRGEKQWWHDPADHLTGFVWQGSTYVLHLTGRPRGWRVLRVTPDGLTLEEHAVPDIGDDDGFIDFVAPAVLDGQAAVMSCEVDNPSRAVVFRSAFDGDRVLGSWTLPEGWKVSGLLSVGERPYACLEFQVPDGTPPEERWRAATRRHGCRFWDITSGVPVGSTLVGHEFDGGQRVVGGRPVALFRVHGGSDHQVWDLARQEPLGPRLAGIGWNLQVGLLHGRPVVADTTRESLRAWDIGTGRLLGSADLPDEPIATAIGPAGTVWAITRTGFVASLAVPPARIHPTAVRHREGCGAGGPRAAVVE